MPRWQNEWGTRVSETQVLEKVVLCYLFPKQCFFAKNFQILWYVAILAGVLWENSEQRIIYAEKRVNNFLNNAEHKIILCKMLEIVYVENSEQFLWENNEQF